MSHLSNELLLADCIAKSIEGANFKWETFFKLWYRKNGAPLYFLFKKNLSVTNTQYVELFSLLTIHSRNGLNKNNLKLLFYSTEHIRGTFTEAMSSLLENYKPEKIDLILSFAKRYLSILNSSVAVDLFFGSCAIFLPPGIEIELEKVVFDSGYIHSAGRSIFIRNIRKAKKSEFIESIGEFLDIYQNVSEKIPFIPYSHEDFSGFDKEFQDQMDRGIDQCKIYVEKMSMGSDRLSSIINDIGLTYNEKLAVPKPGDYRDHLFRSERTIWLISDKSVSGGQLRNAGANRYYICYEQVFKDDSPFYFFDENKPAWKSHTTMPHSLTSALINAARPICEDGVICDPFCGTGTTWFEIKRMHLKVKARCSDLSDATLILLEDNLRFFTMNAEDLEKLMISIKACNPVPPREDQMEFSFTNEPTTTDQYRLISRMIGELRKGQPEEDQEFVLSNSFVERLKTFPLLTRILFYIGLRAQLRYQGGFKRKSLNFEDAFKKSQEKLLEQIGIFLDLKKEIELSITEGSLSESFIKSKGTYSTKLVPTIAFKNLSSKIAEEVFPSFDARGLQVDSCDLIICDPPYGFNTTEDESDLADLYSVFLDKAIAALRKNGQLIICLPSESFTGKELPYCTRSDLVSRQIIVKAHHQNRIVYSPAKSIPQNSFLPPYYWESERALRRTILHFRFI